MQTTGAALLIQLLERQGITHLAGIPGGANLPLYDALGRSRQIRHLLARHEQGAGFIAQGLARVTGRPAVCLGTSGPGATNLLTAIADAYLDSIPLVAITGQVPTALLGTNAFQEVDTCALARPITKFCAQARRPADLLELVPQAFRAAASGRPGPVLIDVPKDVQTATLELDALPPPAHPARPPAFDPQAVTRAAHRLARARRPVLYLGGGIVAAGAAELATRLAEHAGIPACMTLMGLGCVPSHHPLALGMLGMHGARATNLILHECDLLLACGVRFDDRAIGLASAFCPDATIVHIDIDARELGKIKPAHVAIHGDVGEVLAALLPQVPADPRREWRARVAQLRREHPLHLPGANDPRRPYGLLRAFARALGDDAILTTDVGQHQMWAAQVYPFTRPRQLLTSGGLGTMGFGLPAAIGAALAAPDRPIGCLSGDGSLLMNVQELVTAAEEQLPLRLLLFDNQSLGMVHQQQDLFYGRRFTACDFRQRTDFVRLAESFGWHAVSLGDSAAPEATLRAAVRHPGPVLIHAPIAVDEMVYPMVPPGQPNTHMLDGERPAPVPA